MPKCNNGHVGLTGGEGGGLPVMMAVSSRRERREFTFSVYFTRAEFWDSCKLHGFLDVVFTVFR